MKKKYIGIGLFVFVACSVYVYKNSSPVNTEEDIMQLEKHMDKEYALLMEGNTTLVDIDTYDTWIKEAQQAMFDVQDEALYVGKFVCKVNTCQGNPKDENYSVYINVTNKLVEAKEKLSRFKERRSKRKCYEEDRKTLEKLKRDE